MLDAEAPAEPGAVGREAVGQLAAGGTKFLAQAADIASETGKILGDAQFPLDRYKKTRRLALRLAKPEYLRQRNHLVVTLVAENAQNHAVAGCVAQSHRARIAGGFVALAFVMAQHVRPQRTLARVGARSLVVSHP